MSNSATNRYAYAWSPWRPRSSNLPSPTGISTSSPSPAGRPEIFLQTRTLRAPAGMTNSAPRPSSSYVMATSVTSLTNTAGPAEAYSSDMTPQRIEWMR